MTRVFAVQHTARSSVDNCHSDDAVTNARQFTDLLNSTVASVVTSDS
jgi:hypothetical protein